MRLRMFMKDLEQFEGLGAVTRCRTHPLLLYNSLLYIIIIIIIIIITIIIIIIIIIWRNGFLVYWA